MPLPLPCSILFQPISSHHQSQGGTRQFPRANEALSTSPGLQQTQVAPVPAWDDAVGCCARPPEQEDGVVYVFLGQEVGTTVTLS